RRFHDLGLPAEPALDTVRWVPGGIAQLGVASHLQFAARIGPGLVYPARAVATEEHASPVGQRLLPPGVYGVPALAFEARPVDIDSGGARGLDQQRSLLRPDFDRSVAAVAASLVALDGVARRALVSIPLQHAVDCEVHFACHRWRSPIRGRSKLFRVAVEYP